MTRPQRCRSIALVALALAGALLAAACGGGGGADVWSPRALAPDPQAAAQPILVNSQLGVGANRVAFGLVARDGGLIVDARVHTTLFHLDGNTGSPAGGYDFRVSRQETDSAGAAALYVAVVNLDRAGDWGAEVAITLADGKRETPRVRFTVLDRTAEPMVGEAVPASEQQVLRNVASIGDIDSTTPPHPELHGETIKEALAKHRPLVVVFATPAFCRTRFCGPVVQDVLRPLYERHHDRAEFVHVEPYDIAQAKQGRLVPVPIMAEWGLTTEPWLFVIDASGRVAAKFEGIVSLDEAEAALAPLLGPGS